MKEHALHFPKIPARILILLITLTCLFVLFFVIGYFSYLSFGEKIIEKIYSAKTGVMNVRPMTVIREDVSKNLLKLLISFSWLASWFAVAVTWFLRQLMLISWQFLKSRKKIDYLIFLLTAMAGAFILMWPALYNRYPLLYPDTAVYLSAYRPISRPIGYNIFILFTSWGISLWLVVFAQAFLASIVIMRGTDVVICGCSFKKLIPFTAVVLMSAFTMLPKYVSWIMPDIFAGLLFAAGMLFLLSPLKIDRLLAGIVIIISLASHSSHILLGAIVLAFITAPVFIYRARIPAIWNNIKLIAALLALIMISVCFLNSGFGGGFKLSYQNSANFIISRLTNTGVLSKTLDRYCPEKKWKFCEYRKDFAGAVGKGNFWFLWDPSSPITKLGGFEDQTEQNEVASYAFKTFYQEILQLNFKSAVSQLSQFNDHTYISGKSLETDGWGIIKIIKSKYSRDFLFLMNSRAALNLPVKLTLVPCNTIGFQSVIFLLICASMCVFIYKRHVFYIILSLSGLVFIIFNAFLCGFLVGGAERLQGRVMWVLSYCLFLSAGGFLKKIIKSE